MGRIVIKLNPATLENPDLDLRYDVPEKIVELTDGRIESIGYDYLDDGFDSMAIFMKSDTAKEDLNVVCEILKTHTFCDNQLYESAEIYFSDKTDEELEPHDDELSGYEHFQK